MDSLTRASAAGTTLSNPRGLAVVASARDATAAGALLPRGMIDWTILSLFSQRDDALKSVCGAEVIHCGLEDRGWRSRYPEIRPAIRQWLHRVEEQAGPFQQLATHASGDSGTHPAIWHIANLLAGECDGRPLFDLPLRGPRGTSAPEGDDDDEDGTQLLRQPINGQIVQRPAGDSPGVMVSPFWTIPWHRRDATRAALMRRCRPERWYVIMADTTHGNLPPNYILPFAGGRFSVDPDEQRYFRDRFPDLDMLEFCQSQLTPADLYAPMPGLAKEFDLVYSARICEVKRHGMLLDALAALKQAGRPLKTLLLFYPKDNEDTLRTTQMVRERVEQAQLDVTFHTTGARGNNEAEVAAWLNRSKLGVFLSAEEGPAFAIPEYLLCDLPVVAYAGLRGGGLHFLNPENSLLFEGAEDLPQVLLAALAAQPELQPRRSAIAQSIGEEAGNVRFAAVLAEHGIHLRADAEPLRRHLDTICLEELCR